MYLPGELLVNTFSDAVAERQELKQKAVGGGLELPIHMCDKIPQLSLFSETLEQLKTEFPWLDEAASEYSAYCTQKKCQTNNLWGSFSTCLTRAIKQEYLLFVAESQDDDLQQNPRLNTEIGRSKLVLGVASDFFTSIRVSMSHDMAPGITLQVAERSMYHDPYLLDTLVKVYEPFTNVSKYLIAKAISSRYSGYADILDRYVSMTTDINRDKRLSDRVIQHALFSADPDGYISAFLDKMERYISDPRFKSLSYDQVYKAVMNHAEPDYYLGQELNNPEKYRRYWEILYKHKGEKPNWRVLREVGIKPFEYKLLRDYYLGKSQVLPRNGLLSRLSDYGQCVLND